MILFNLLILKICRYFSLVLCEWELKRCTGFVEVVIKMHKDAMIVLTSRFCAQIYTSPSIINLVFTWGTVFYEVTIYDV